MADIIFYALIFLISLAAALIDVIVGGSNLFTVPALMILGVSPLMAIGTIRVFVTVFTLTGFLHYLHKRVKLNFKILAEMIAVRAMGAFVGSHIVLQVPVEVIRQAVAVLMIGAVVSIVYLRHRKGKPPHSEAIHPHLSHLVIVLSLMFGLGLYEGFVGEGQA